MATYTITLNERTSSGKALMAYLKALGVLVSKVTPKAKSSYLRSQEDKLAGRVEKFSSSEEMFKSLGIWVHMYEIRMTKTFRKDTERCRKRGYDIKLNSFILFKFLKCLIILFQLFIFQELEN